MRIEKVTENKKRFLDLLLLADEQEDMIDRYLPDGDLFVLYDDEVKYDLSKKEFEARKLNHNP